MVKISVKPILPLVMGTLALLLGLIRWYFPERSLMLTGPRALLDAGFALGLLGAVLLLTGGLGSKALQWLKVDGLTGCERILFGLPIGLGILAYGVLALGLAGLLRSWTVLIWLVALSLWTWREWSEIVIRTIGWLRGSRRNWIGLAPVQKALLFLGGLILFLSLFQALVPPWEYDALMYHLQGPRQFLDAGRILLLPDNWPANYPATVEMLFTLGLAFGSDTFAKLMHLTYAILLILATFAFGRRYLNSAKAWLAAAILLGIPILPLWASLAYADMAWALCQFLGLYALVLWTQSGRRQWLVLSGLTTGLAIGSKYLALGGAVVLGLWVLWHGRTQGWRTVLANAALFGATALLVGSPWYIKNWTWGGNPVFPLFFGGREWTMDRLEWVNVYHSGFGTGRNFLDYLLLPWNLYAHHERFGTVAGSIELPSLFFPVALVYPWTLRSKVMNSVASVTLLWFMVWAAGVQQIRHLLPLFPGLGLLASAVLMDLADRPVLQRWGRPLVVGLTGGMIVTTLLYSLLFFAAVQPWRVAWGLESKDDFLRRRVNDYAALQFVRANLKPQARVLMLWDAQGYYCDERCLPDTEHSQWTRLVETQPDVTSLAARLRDLGVTHLLFSTSDADFILQHDPTGQNLYAADFFLHQFRPSCTREVYRDHWTSLFELTC
jgi:hypothetical protein